MQMTRAVLTPRAVWWRARAPVGLSKLCQLLALSAWHGIAQERSAGSSIKQISALTHFASAQSPIPASKTTGSGLAHLLRGVLLKSGARRRRSAGVA